MGNLSSSNDNENDIKTDEQNDNLNNYICRNNKVLPNYYI